MTKNEDTTKSAKSAKSSAKAASPARKPRAAKPKTELLEAIAEAPAPFQATVAETVVIPLIKPEIEKGRYVFATGRRKSAIANIRLFSGPGKIVINKKPFEDYFFHQMYRDEATQPFRLTGLGEDFYFTANVSGSGIKAQSQAVRHALAHALGSLDGELRKQMKRAGLLTRDYREKERKKPGLKRARRSPQWAKR